LTPAEQGRSGAPIPIRCLSYRALREPKGYLVGFAKLAIAVEGIGVELVLSDCGLNQKTEEVIEPGKGRFTRQSRWFTYPTRTYEKDGATHKVPLIHLSKDDFWRFMDTAVAALDSYLESQGAQGGEA
jgi:hypothetical protein